jgi:hypothetical protein
MRPAGDLGGGDSRALRQPATGVAERSRLVGQVTSSGLSECSGENGRTGVTAESMLPVWQQDALLSAPCMPHFWAMLLWAMLRRQHAGGAPGCIASRQTDAGRAVHKTTVASISNANFLPQRIIVVSQFQL